MRIIKTGAAVLMALVLSVGMAVADDSAQIVGEWLDNLPNGARMITVFTPTSIAFHGIDPQGNEGPTNTVQVTFKKNDKGGIYILANQGGDPLSVTVKDANTLLLQFPGADARTLTRQKPAAKK